MRRMRSLSLVVLLLIGVFGIIYGDAIPNSAANAVPTGPLSGKSQKKLSHSKPIPAESSKSSVSDSEFIDSKDTEESQSKSLSTEREALYDAYNQLHTLAQDFQKPFDAPAVIVVGHQTSGKSALIEALMGFQFNQVGGGTKTRRPIALRMQYNPHCHTPMCFLTLENGKEEARSLSDIQQYIESENKRLERDAHRSFDPREINIRMEYKYSPNMIVIDTPGLIHPPKGRSLTMQQRAIAQAAREAEALVLSKMRCEDYIILCVEDTTDWKHATTRNLVMQVDPSLSRTVLVTTKLDTKLPQFAEAADLEEFLSAPLLHSLFGQMMGGPFFTTVPAARVASSTSSGVTSTSNLEPDYNGNSFQLQNNEQFVSALRKAERHDRLFVSSKLAQLLGALQSTGNTQPSHRNQRSRVALQNVGVSRLKAFLEKKIEDCYRTNVGKIVPLLQSELKRSQQILQSTDEALQSLSLEKLKQSGHNYRDCFAKELAHIIQGTVRVSPEVFGETLESETARGGAFLSREQLFQQSPSSISQRQETSKTDALYQQQSRLHSRQAKSSPQLMSLRDSSSTSSSTTEQHQWQQAEQQWQETIEREVGNNHHKLFGGAQYHRAIREFTIAVRHLHTAHVSEDEIANAAGIGDTHSGVNFMRAACVIAMEKAQLSFEPLLVALRMRMEYVLKRLFPIVHHLVKQSFALSPSTTSSLSPSASTLTANSVDTLNAELQETIRKIYDSFIEQKLEDCVRLCRADLVGMTKFVTWDVEDRSGSSTLFRLLPTPKRMVEIYKFALANRDKKQSPAVSAIDSESGSRSRSAREDEDDNDVFLSADGDTVDENTADSFDGRELSASRGSRGSRLPQNIASKVFTEWKQANRPARGTRGSFWSSSKPAKSLATTTPSEVHRTLTGDSLALATPSAENDPELHDYYKVVQLTEEMVSGSNGSRTSALITSLVQYIISSWRNYFARSTAMKFNCYFLLPFTEEFPMYLRDQLEKHYDMTEMFDVSETRRALLSRRQELAAECDAYHKLQLQFDQIAAQLKKTVAEDLNSAI